MRKKLFSALLAIVLLTTLAGTAFADLPGGGWVTNTQIQNVGPDQADVQISSYGGGAKYDSAVKPASPGGSVTFLASELNIPSPFNGAGVIGSTQPAFAILFVTNYGTGAGNTGSAIVQGIGENNVATRINFPLAKKRWGSGQKTTTFYIQNAGTQATNVTATITAISGSCTNNPRVFSNVKQNEQINFTPADLGCAAPMYGSLTVVSDGQNLAGMVLEADDDMNAPSGGTKVLAGTTGFAPNAADSTLIAPIIKKGWGKNANVTGLQVQNVGAATIPAGHLKVTYSIIGGPDAGTTKTETNASDIAVGASYNSLHPSLTQGTLASAVVTTDAQYQIVGIVNENRPAGNPQPRATTYSMLAQKSAATSVSLPLVKEFYGAQGGRCTGVQVVPVGGQAKMQLTYKSGAQTYVVTTNNAVGTKTFLNLSSGTDSTVSISGGAWADMRGKNFGVTATSLTSGVKLVAVANESFCPGSTRDEDDANYEAFPLP